MFDAVADLLNFEVDLIFFGTTSTSFETDDADTALWRDSTGRPVTTTNTDSAGNSAATAASEDDLPQAIVGMAVARTGIPVRVWSCRATPPTRG